MILPCCEKEATSCGVRNVRAENFPDNMNVDLYIQKLIEKGYEARCVEVKCKWRRRVLIQLRGSTTALEVETGKWRGASREGRVCRNCRSEEVENVKH